MAETPQQRKSKEGKERFGENVGRQAARKLRARKEQGHPVWFGLGMFGLVGWSVVLPTLLGIALGVWLDTRWPDRPSWTLTFLIIGLALGCLNAWVWIKQESEND